MPKVQLLNQFFKSLQVKGLFEKFIKNVTFIEADNGNCVATLKLGQENFDLNGNLHAGYCTAVIDAISGYGLLSLDDWMVPSFSVSISVSILGNAKCGEEIKLISKVLKAGQTMAFLDVELRNIHSNELLVKAEHTKYKV